MRKVTLIAVLMLVCLIAPAGAASDSRFFAETGHTVRGKFLAYWQEHGDLARFGFPIAEEMQEVSELDGKGYTVQYFERAEFELHPEYVSPSDVLLTQLGTLWLKETHDKSPAAGKDDGSGSYFAATGHSITGRFRDYWEQEGGLASFGYPLSERLRETSPLDGKTYTVQYFERAVFELHSDNQPPDDVLLTQLGTFRYKAKYLSPATPTPSPLANTPAPTAPTVTPAPTTVPATPTIDADPALTPAVYIAEPNVKHGSYQTITITSQPGAKVTVVCTYPSGDQTSNGCSKPFKDGPLTADEHGKLVLRWRIGSTTHLGQVIVDVRVEVDGRVGAARTSFQII